MGCSLEDYLNVVTPYLHPELVSPEALSYIQTLARVLPPFSLAGFESRLGVAQPVVDLLVRFSCMQLNLPAEFLAYPAWQALDSFCQEQRNPHCFTYDKVHHIWLEFDLDRPPEPVPIPCLFLSLNTVTVADTRSLIEMARRIPNYSISPAIESNLQLCAQSLPPNAKIEHLGAMLSRPGKAVRTVITGIRAEQIPDYLAKIGWSDPTNQLESLVSSLCEHVDSIGILDLDVGDEIAPKIGLECFIHKQSNYEDRRQLFLNYLVDNNLSTPAKSNALLSWSGLTQKSPDTELWPDNLTLGDLFLGARAHSVFWRSLNHIKISYQPGKPLDAKAYLAFGHNWFKTNSLEKNAKAATSLERSVLV